MIGEGKTVRSTVPTEPFPCCLHMANQIIKPVNTKKNKYKKKIRDSYFSDDVS